jgi:hypothetical protein
LRFGVPQVGYLKLAAPPVSLANPSSLGSGIGVLVCGRCILNYCPKSLAALTAGRFVSPKHWQPLGFLVEDICHLLIASCCCDICTFCNRMSSLLPSLPEAKGTQGQGKFHKTCSTDVSMGVAVAV